MNTVIVGQGAIGLLFYCHLNQHKDKNSVSLVSSNEAFSSQNSIHYFPYATPTSSTPVALSHASEEDLKQAELILVCVKSFQVKDALLTLLPKTNPNAVIALSHNGLGVIEELLDENLCNHFLTNRSVLALLTTHGAKKLSPTEIVHTGEGAIDLGFLTGQFNEYQKQTVLKSLSECFSSVNWHQDIRLIQWTKLAINCVINPLTAINNVKNGEITTDKFTGITESLIREIVTVASTQGIALSESSLINKVREVALLTAKNTSSMRSDMLKKQHTEIDYINGYVSKLGEKENITTPENTRLWQKIKALESNS